MLIGIVKPCRAASHRIGLLAVRALYRELALYPKPGLVSFVDQGAHEDMDAGRFLRSLFALRRYFVLVAEAGADGAAFERLRELGRWAERRMAQATGGINTHRGAVFSLGLLAAAAGYRLARGLTPDGAALAAHVAEDWGTGIAAAGEQSEDSHGSRAVRRFGARGARDEALEGFPTLLDSALPALRHGRDIFAERDLAELHCLFAIMATLQDTNLLHRGGLAGLGFVQESAARFLHEGGFARTDGMEQALALHRACIARRLSPGGAADLLAAAIFVESLAP